jgi:hypothetical protein
MVDFKKTEQLYIRQGLVYQKKPHEIEYERWYKSVTNPHKKDNDTPGTGAGRGGQTEAERESYYYYQIHELRSAGLVPEDFGDDRRDRFDSTKLKVYPEKIARSILRVQDMSGNEWLKSKQMWTGMDRLGNEIPQSVSDPETYEDPQFKYEYKHKDPKDPMSPLERKPVAGTEHIRKYLVTFTEENFQKILTIRPAIDMHSVNLTIMRINANGSGRGAPYAIENLDDFKNRPFDELYDWASASKNKSDTKLGRTNLDKDKDNKHYR